MKISAIFFLTDILPHKRKLYHKIVKNKIFEGFSIKEAFARLRKTGVEGVELLLPSFAKIVDDDIIEVKNVLTENQMQILSVHQVIRFFTKTHIDEIKRLFHIAKTLEAKIVVLHMSSIGKQVFDKEYVEAIHDLQNKYGIKAGFENRERVVGGLSKKHGWHGDTFSELMKKNDFYITFDTTHLAQTGGDIVKFFNKNKDRIINIHLSDYRHHFLNTTLRPMRYKHLPLGKGDLPIEKFLKQVKNANYQGLITMEIHTDLQGICESAQIISAALKGKQ